MGTEIDGKLLLVSDPAARLITCLGLADGEPALSHVVARPATFIVDGDGRVRYRYVGRSPEDRPKAALLLLAVERLAAE